MGQVIKRSSLKLGEFYEIDFCSKISTSDGSIDSWNLFRDPAKTLTTKQYYMKRNNNIVNNPSLHSLALYLGYKA